MFSTKTTTSTAVRLSGRQSVRGEVRIPLFLQAKPLIRYLMAWRKQARPSTGFRPRHSKTLSLTWSIVNSKCSADENSKEVTADRVAPDGGSGATNQGPWFVPVDVLQGSCSGWRRSSWTLANATWGLGYEYFCKIHLHGVPNKPRVE